MTSIRSVEKVIHFGQRVTHDKVISRLIVDAGGGGENFALDGAKRDAAVDAEAHVRAVDLARVRAALQFESARARGEAHLERLAHGRTRKRAHDSVAGEGDDVAVELVDDRKERLKIEIDCGRERVGPSLVREGGRDLGVARDVDEEKTGLAAPRHHHLGQFGRLGLLRLPARRARFLLFAGEKMRIVLDPAAVRQLG